MAPLQHSVPRYGKIEFRIELDREYSHPFDPDEVDLAMVLDSPSGRRQVVPAFSLQPCERRKLEGVRSGQDWIYPSGTAVWMVRFAPAEVGTYRGTARLIDRRGTAESEPVSFTSRDSDGRGFVRVHPRAAHCFAFDNGETFFPIGQNLAFIGPGQAMTLSKAERVFAELAKNGANFVRIWTGCQDWAMAIEAPRSAWGRSWGQPAPIAELPGGEGQKAVPIGGPAPDRIVAAPYDRIPVRPETRYILSGRCIPEGAKGLRLTVPGRANRAAETAFGGDAETSFRHAFRTEEEQYYLERITLERLGDGLVWLTALSLREADGGPELLLDADPNLPARGIYHQIDALMLDVLVESAREHGIYLQLCVTMRDLYMKSLENPAGPEYQVAIRDARKLMRYFVARWGYSTSVAAWEYFNEIDPGRPTASFYAEMAEYLERTDPYRHLRTTSTWSTSHRDWRHAALDVAQEHFYLRPGNLEKLPDVVAAVLDRSRDLRAHSDSRPMLLAEFGLADEKWGLSPRMKEDRRLEHFHNALWASALSGLSGTAMFWWWEELDRRDAYGHYGPLARFAREIPFASAGLEPRAAQVDAPLAITAIGLQGPSGGYFWLYVPEQAWERRPDRSEHPGEEVSGAVLKLAGLKAGRYSIRWWDTWTGRIVHRERAAVSDRSTDLAVPAFRKDIACQVVPDEDP